MDDREYSLEREKLDLEKSKLRWTAWSVALPVVLGVLAIGKGTFDLRQQAKDQFKIKAAEITLNSATPDEAIARATFLSDLFPNELPELKNKVAALHPTKYGMTGDPRAKDKIELIKLLTQKDDPAQRKRVLLYWSCLFKNDEELLNPFRSSSSPSFGECAP